mgnify:CR=1 FL=1
MESTRISNAVGQQKIIESPSMIRYNQFNIAKQIINDLCVIENMYEDMYEAENRYKELKNENLFQGKYSSAERVMKKRLKDMQTVLENDPDENGTKEFYSAFSTCINHYNMIKERENGRANNNFEAK